MKNSVRNRIAYKYIFHLIETKSENLESLIKIMRQARDCAGVHEKVRELEKNIQAKYVGQDNAAFDCLIIRSCLSRFVAEAKNKPVQNLANTIGISLAEEEAFLVLIEEEVHLIDEFIKIVHRIH
jgi:hypothetical protein